MSELHAAVALSGLEGLDDRLEHRRGLVEAFWCRVQGVPGLRPPAVDPADTTTYKDLTLVVTPDELGLDVPTMTAAFSAEGIDSRRYFYPPIHQQKAYVGRPDQRALPVTDDLSQRVITPPLWSSMSVDDVHRLGDLVLAMHEHAVAIARSVE
jgi:dTDP-4-amino-4,6-dideoxygalactose transaminase